MFILTQNSKYFSLVLLKMKGITIELLKIDKLEKANKYSVAIYYDNKVVHNISNSLKSTNELIFLKGAQVVFIDTININGVLKIVLTEPKGFIKTLSYTAEFSLKNLYKSNVLFKNQIQKHF
jgi:hypothetical protein